MIALTAPLQLAAAPAPLVQETTDGFRRTCTYALESATTRAMRKADKAVEFVSIPLADHYFTREADRTTLLTSIEAFLAKHNPPD